MAIHNIKNVAPIPPSISPQQIIEALHEHRNILIRGAITQSVADTPTPMAVAASDSFFNASIPLSSYLVTEGLTIIPRLYTYPLTFPVCFQNTTSGVLCRVNSSGIIVHGIYSVERVEAGTALGDAERVMEGDVEWVLVERASVECTGWLAPMMPFIKNTFEGAHKPICRDLVEGVGRKVLEEG